jgi:hypothetical protein
MLPSMNQVSDKSFIRVIILLFTKKSGSKNGESARKKQSLQGSFLSTNNYSPADWRQAPINVSYTVTPN